MPAPQFKASTSRADPYKSFRFRVKWEGNDVAGFSEVSGLTRTTAVVKRRAGGAPGAVQRGRTEGACL